MPQYSAAGQFQGGWAIVSDKNRLLTFIDKDGRQLLEPRFYNALPFHDGTAWVKESQWGMIDTSGQFVIPMMYKELEHFSGNIYSVRRNNKWTFITREGKELYAPRFGRIGNLIKGFAGCLIGNDSIAVVNDQAEILFTTKGRNYRLHDDKYFQIDITKVFNIDGSEILPGRFDGLVWMREGLLAAQTDGMWRLVNYAGVVQSPHKYEQVERFQHGLAAVQRSQWTVIDQDLSELCPPQFARIKILENGHAIGTTSVKDQYLDQNGAILNSVHESSARGNHKPGFANIYTDDQVKVLNNKGEAVLEMRFDRVYNTERNPGTQDPYVFTPNGYAFVVLDGRSMIIDQSGTTIVQADSTTTPGLHRDGIIQIHSIQADGKPSSDFRLFNPLDSTLSSETFDHIQVLNQGLAAIRLAPRGRFGFVDNMGRMVIKPQFNDAFDFFEGYAAVQRDGLRPGPGADVAAHREGVGANVYGPLPGDVRARYRMHHRGNIALTDRRGTILVEEDPRSSGPVMIGKDHVTFENNGKWGIKHFDGTIVNQAQWSQIFAVSGSLFQVQLANGLIVFMDTYGRKYWKE